MESHNNGAAAAVTADTARNSRDDRSSSSRRRSRSRSRSVPSHMRRGDDSNHSSSRSSSKWDKQSSFSSKPPPGAPVSTTLDMCLGGEKCMPTVRNTPTLYTGPLLTLGASTAAALNAASVAVTAAAALAPGGFPPSGTSAAAAAALAAAAEASKLHLSSSSTSNTSTSNTSTSSSSSTAAAAVARGIGTGGGSGSSALPHQQQQQPPPPAVPPPPSAAVGRAVPSNTALSLLHEKQKLQLHMQQQQQEQLLNASPAQVLLAMKINDVDFDRKQRRLYVGNLPPGSTQPDVVGFFNGALLAVNAQTGYVKEERLDAAAASVAKGKKDASAAAAAEKTISTTTAQELLPVERCEVFNESSRFCFIELRNQAYTILCIKLDGINYNGFSLRVGRPHDYIAPPGGDPALSAHIPLLDDVKKTAKTEEKKEGGAAASRSDSGADTKIYVQNLPPEMGEEQVRDLFEQFGKLRVLNLIKNVQTGQHKGYGFFEYEDPDITDHAIMALNGFVCGANILSVQRANFSHTLVSKDSQRSPPVTQLPMSMTRTLLSDPLVAVQVQAARRIGERPSKVVQLLNCVYQEDVVSDMLLSLLKIDTKEYETLCEDIKQEAEKHGRLEEILIPRPREDLSYREGVGKVFLRYSDVTAARKAQLMLNGRRFDGSRVVCAAFFPEDKFSSGKYTLT